MSMAGNQGPMTKAEKIQAFLDRRRAEDLQRQYLSSGMQTGADEEYDDSQNLLDLVPDEDDEAAFQQRLDEAMKESLLIHQLQSPVDYNDDMAAQLQMEEVLQDSITEAVKHKQATSLTPDQQDLVLPLSNGPEKGTVGGKTKKSKHLKKDKRKKAITGDVDGFDSSEDQGSSDGSCSSAEFEDASEEIQDVLKSRGKKSGRRKKLTWRERKNLRKTSGTVGCHNVEVLQDELLNADVNPELAEVLRSQAENLRSGHSRRPAKQRDSQDQACDDNSLNNGDLLSSTDQSVYRVEIEPRLELSAFADDGFPETWNRQAPGSTDESDGDSSHIYRLFPLSPGDAEYCAIAQEFSQASLEVKSIERLQHPFLLDKYKTERELVLKSRHSEFELNEKYLYHGTRAEKRLICEEGLDQRLSRTGHFGRGIYFSDNPRKCMHYSGKQKSSGPAQPSYILKCRVILGDTKIYRHGNSEPTLKREPLRDNPVGGWKYYDSVKGCPKDFNEFVIYEGRRAITEYIITYQQSTLAPPSGGEKGQQSESIRPSDPVIVNTKSTLKWTKVVPGKKEDQNSAVAVDHNKTDGEKNSRFS